MDGSLILIGASVRAAAFSALRAGLRPWCADMFGDLDLRRQCPCETVSGRDYPNGFLDLLSHAPSGPIVYTGALENSGGVLSQLSKLRKLWGNLSGTLRLVRNPFIVENRLSEVSLPAPRCRLLESASRGGRWLLKPHSSASGVVIRFWDGQPLSPRRAVSCYLQEYIEGDSGSALFLGWGHRGSHLLGITRQLVGQEWLNSEGFRYCGSVGPWNLTDSATVILKKIGDTLTRATDLLGLFGIDFVLRDDVPYPVEINPRYTASVEVLEHSTGLRAMALHCEAFESRGLPDVPLAPSSPPRSVVGKAIYYAPRTFTIPAEGPWMTTLREPPHIDRLPEFADISAPEQVIQAGHPVLTFFARANDETACLARLRQTAATLDRTFAAV